MPREGTGTRDYEISLAAPENIPDIVTLQDPNVMDCGGTMTTLARLFNPKQSFPWVVNRRKAADSNP